MKLKQLYYAHVFLLSILGTVIACSPTKFTPVTAVNADCTSGCVVNTDGTKNWDDAHKIGTGKVDILFVNDNSASMAVIQQRLAQAFGGFIERLDQREIDYKIAMTTTDARKVLASGNSSPGNSLISFGNGSTFLTKNDSNRVSLFNGAIVRTETTACENIIKSYYANCGASFQSNSQCVLLNGSNGYETYAQAYNRVCASGDERGILMANHVLANNVNNFVRSDAHLNVIVISNEDVRSGAYSNAAYALTTEDTAQGLNSAMSSKYAGKYWEFNSIITKDSTCALQQQQAFAVNGQPVKDQAGNYVISANPGTQYAAVSSSASQDVNGNAQPRGQIIDICQTNYSDKFALMAAKVNETALTYVLKCSPLAAPVVEVEGNPAATVPHTWNGNKIIFNSTYAGTPVRVKYTCPQSGGVQ